MLDFISVKLPFISETVQTVKVVKIHVQPFEKIRIGDVLLTVEFDNVQIDIPCEKSGIVMEISVEQGQVISRYQQVCILSGLESSSRIIDSMKNNLENLNKDFQKLLQLNRLYLELIQVLDLPYNSSNEMIIEEIRNLKQLS